MDDLSFNDYVSSYQYEMTCSTHEIGKKRAQQEVGTFNQFYQEQLKQSVSSHKSLHLRLEFAWHMSNTPYYKVYPDYVSMFGETDCNVALKDLNMPYRVFAVRFCKGKEPTLIGRPVGAAILACTRLDGGFITLGMASNYCDGRLDAFRLWSTGPLPEDQQYTIAELIAGVKANVATVSDDSSGQNENDLCRLLRVCINTGMVATCDGEVEEDVMSRDIAEYVEAVNKNKPKAAALGLKAKNQRNGVPGFTFGRGEWLLGRVKQAGGGGEPHETGVPLTFGHVRKGHYHHYWSGPGKTVLIRKWTRPCRVRPDLTLNDAARPGEHTLDSKTIQDNILGGKV